MRDRDLVAQRRVLGVAERHEQEVGRDERRVLGLREPDRRVEHGRVERAAGERDEDAPRAGCAAGAAGTPLRDDERRAEHGGERGESDDGGDHSVSRSRSARFATTRMSRPGSSRTMRERSEPPKISRRRDSSGVPTKMYVEPRSRGDAAHRRDEVVALLLEEVRAEDAGEPPQSRELGHLLLGRRRPVGPHPERVHVGAEAAGPSARRGA